LATSLPLERTVAPTAQAEVAELIRAAHDARQPVYPLGGGTSLGFGLPAKQPGLGLDLRSLNKIVDYPARDMTITVAAGTTLQALADTLAAERQRLPIDVPDVEQATLGGVIATNSSGALRYGHGTIRDFVIGISAVDGRGRPFKGGGRVVKNVAGYDFCKLLTGSLGTLGVITQVTLKIRPSAEKTALVVCDLPTVAAAEPVLAALVNTRTTPVAVELLAGPVWQADPALGQAAAEQGARLAVGLEGSAVEVDWMVAQLRREWHDLGGIEGRAITDAETPGLWQRLAQFPAEAEAPLVLKANVLPAAVAGFVQLVRTIDPQSSVQAHAGNGIVIARFPDFPAGKVSGQLIGVLQPAAAKAGGNVVVLSSTYSADLTARAVWGIRREAADLMQAVKREFDPRGVLNPGRFCLD
jgi:glycolate oxidase FAD binding subunit